MGLDMYLYKARKLKEGITAKEICQANGVISWRTDKNGFTLKVWDKLDEREIDWDLVNSYETVANTHYYDWDECKEFPCYGVLEPIKYWSEEKNIHSLFVDIVQNGKDDYGSYEVSKEQIEEILEKCYLELKPSGRDILSNSIENIEYKAKIPSDTIEILEKVLDTTDFNKEMIIYRSSW